LAWARKNENVSTVITGATKPEQVNENIASQQFLEALNSEIMERIEGVLENKPDLGVGD